MFFITLKFSDNKASAPQYMDGHNAWIKQGFDDGIFLVVGSLQPNLGGSIIAHRGSRNEIETRINQDPFVAENVVSAEIFEVAPAKVDERLQFLLDEPTATA